MFLVASAFALSVSPLNAKAVKLKQECEAGMEGEAECRQAMLIDEGFHVFTEETFEGNGRTCSTCHIPRESYNIFPSTLKRLNKKEKKLVFADNVPGLENRDLIKTHGLFNISGRADTCLANEPSCFHTPGEEHSGPIFRSTMGIFATELNSIPAINHAGTPLLPPECSDGIATTLPQFGWAGDGAPGTTNFFDGNGDGFNDCQVHHDTFDADADGSLRAFANGAIAQHSPKSLNRILGVDFRFANDDELDAMEALQNWLGRRKLTAEERAIEGLLPTDRGWEFSLALLDFKDPRVALGRDHYLAPASFGPGGPRNPLPPLTESDPNAGAGCNACHNNGGGRGVFPAGGGNTNINTEVELASDDIGLAVVGTPLPHDEGGFGSVGPPDGLEAFNMQSIIEAAQKGAWFHNHKTVNDFEEAIAHYISDDFQNGPGAITPPEVMRFGNAFLGSPDTTNLISFPNGDGVEHLGAFLRALNAFYNLRDCERLIDEAVQRVDWGISPEVPIRHCEFNLEHVERVLKGSKLKKLHLDVSKGARKAKRKVKTAAKKGNKRNLLRVKETIRNLRDSIATQVNVAASS